MKCTVQDPKVLAVSWNTRKEPNQPDGAYLNSKRKGLAGLVFLPF